MRRNSEPRSLTPGEIYTGIAVEYSDFEGKTEKKLVKKVTHPFVAYCKRLHNLVPGIGKGSVYQREYQDAINFLGWDLTANEFNGAITLTFILSLIGFLILAFLADLSPLGQLLAGFLNNALIAKAYLYIPALVASLLATYYAQQFPLSEAKAEQTRALTYVPEIMGYMIMSMKLVPNLEKAVEFAADHGRGKIATDFRQAIWDVQLGVYGTLSEALDALAYRWGKFSDEFKRSLMMVRASVLENTEAKRHQMLDKTMQTVLDSVKNKMEDYARGLQEPSTLLFYVGVLLPLILIIILPVGSAFSGQPLAMPLVLVIIYNLAIPAVVFLFARSVINKRPPTYEPPKIPVDYPGIPRRGNMRLGTAQAPILFVISVVIIAGGIGAYFLSQEGFPPRSLVGDNFFQIIPYDRTEAEVLAKAGRPETYFDTDGQFYREQLRFSNETQARKTLIIARQEFYNQPGNDTTPFALVFGVLFTFALCVHLFLYHTYIYRREVQQEIMQLETEFKDSLYILASRLGENKPVEEALRHVKSFLPNLKVSDRVFGKTIDNIQLLGMPLEAAVFDPMYGSVKNIPSNMIQSSMKLLIDSVQLGVNLAARTLISLSLQLSNAEKVTRLLSTLVSDITGMMTTMVVFIAPIVLGITVALQKIVMRTLASVAGSSFVDTGTAAGDISAQAGIRLPSVTTIDVNVFVALVTPLQFLIIVGVYVVELVIIMSYFTTKIEEDNNLMVALNIAKSLPIAIIVFLVSVVLANSVVGGFLG